MTSKKSDSTLHDLPFCSPLTDDRVRQLEACSITRRYGAGETLFQESAAFEDLLLVRRGKVQLQMRIPGRGAIPILTLGPGQIVAWSAILGAGEMTTSAIALEETEVVALPGKCIEELCERDPAFGYYFMRRLADAIARRLVATRLQMLDLFSQDLRPYASEQENHGKAG